MNEKGFSVQGYRFKLEQAEEKLENALREINVLKMQLVLAAKEKEQLAHKCQMLEDEVAELEDENISMEWELDMMQRELWGLTNFKNEV